MGKVAPNNELVLEMIQEILSRLPAKSLVRFSLVSKEWLALISDTLKHRKLPCLMCGLFYNSQTITKEDKFIVRYAKIPNGLVEHSSSIDQSLTFLPAPHKFLVLVDVCNGLVLCKGTESLSDRIRPGVLYVCNPATKKYITIPTSPTRLVSAVLDFNPILDSKHFSIFKIDHRCSNQPSGYNFEVFSSRTGSWKVSQVEDPIFEQVRFFAFKTVLFQGLLYVVNEKISVAIGIDPRGNICHRIELPGKSHRKGCICIGVSSGVLHYAYRMLEEDETVCVWKLDHIDNTNSNWVLKHRISTAHIKENLRIIRFHPDMDVLFLKLNQKLFSLNMKILSRRCGMRKAHLHRIYSKDNGLMFYLPYSPCYLEGFDNV